MAQVNSVQREPSMEEILASIRRIIEDSDGVRKTGDGTAPPAVNESAPAPSAVDPREAQGDSPPGFASRQQARPGERFEETRSLPKAELESFRAELGSSVPDASDRGAPPAAGAPAAALAPQRPALQPEAAARTFRLADIQAQLARETAAPQSAQPEQRPLTMVDIQQEIATTALRSAGASTSAGPEPALDEMELPTVAPQPSPAQPSPAPFVAVERINRAAAIPLHEEAPADAVPVPVVNEVPDPETPSEPLIAPPGPARQSIISAAASRQVAAAFGELSEAFAARSKKTFDELAEQMLRPMLQEWLDNNLPLLVERLVREEIERVARGS